MEYSNECPFCSNTRYINNRLVNSPAEEAVLFENNDLYVRVDISPLCLGHILIITNKHYLNFFEIPKEIKKQVIKLKDNIKNVYKQLYDTDVLFFEHGSAKSGYAGASIDHAHLHCIPYKFDISDYLNKVLGSPEECNIISSKKEFHNEFSYIYIESEHNGSKIYKVEKLPSQFLRKLVFEKQGKLEYKWQEKCMKLESIEDLNQTIIDLKDKIYIT